MGDNAKTKPKPGPFGETTKALINYLLENGPQTRAALERLPFWGGVRSRIPKLIEQGRLVKVSLVNDDESLSSRNILIGYRATGLNVEPIRRTSRYSEDAKEARRISRNAVRDARRTERRIKAAIEFLVGHGYSVERNHESAAPQKELP